MIVRTVEVRKASSRGARRVLCLSVGLGFLASLGVPSRLCHRDRYEHRDFSYERCVEEGRLHLIGRRLGLIEPGEFEDYSDSLEPLVRDVGARGVVFGVAAVFTLILATIVIAAARAFGFLVRALRRDPGSSVP